MDLASVVPIVVSVLAFVLGIANYVRSLNDRRVTNRVEADKLIEEVRELLPTNQAGHFQAKDLGRDPRARSLVDRAASLDGKHPRVVLYQGYIHMEDGRQDEARTCFERLLTGSESNWRAYMALGDLTDGEERLSCFTLAVRYARGRESALPLMRLATEHVATEELDLAINYFEECIKADAEYVPAHIHLARVYAQRGQLVEARKHLGQAIRLDRSSTEAMVDLAQVLVREGEWDEARKWIQRAMDANPTSSEPLAMMGAFHCDREEWDEGVEWFERAVRLEGALALEGEAVRDMLAEAREHQQKHKRVAEAEQRSL
jgi:tetratricopeptide (TPR) repeat protein